MRTDVVGLMPTNKWFYFQISPSVVQIVMLMIINGLRGLLSLRYLVCRSGPLSIVYLLAP